MRIFTQKSRFGALWQPGMAKQRKTEKTKRQEKMHVKQDYPYYAKEESNKKRSTKDKKQTKGGTIREKNYYIQIGV